MTPAVVVLLVLAQAPGGQVPPEAAAPPASSPEAVPLAGMPAPAPESRRWHSLIRMEASMLALLPRGAVVEEVGYAQLTPTVVLDGGAQWGLHVGASVLMRLWGGGAGAGRVRKEDWDSLSDWGQLVRALKLGNDSSPVGLWVGALEDYTPSCRGT